jgi:hypothetical protein
MIVMRFHAGNSKAEYPKHAGMGGTKVAVLHCERDRGLSCMTSPEKYRRFAQECLEIAHSAKDDRTRAVLLQMAAVWFRLAEEKASTDSDEQCD